MLFYFLISHATCHKMKFEKNILLRRRCMKVKMLLWKYFSPLCTNQAGVAKNDELAQLEKRGFQTARDGFNIFLSFLLQL